MKKLLALVLALVMTLSLCVVSSNAKFDDAADIDFKEAADVMQAVGVFVGDGSGNFYPKQNLTREQAAKVIAYLDLGESVAEALPSIGTFSDVSSWANKYVDYLANAKIVNGIGGGKFGGTNQVTGYEFAKMLLVVLGWDAEIEGMTGSAWQIGVAKLVKEYKIAKGYKVNLSEPLTREAAAKLTFNAIQRAYVDHYEYNGGFTIVDNELNYNAEGKAVLATRAVYDDDGDDIIGYENVPFYQHHWTGNDKLTYVGEDTDFGQPSHQWKYQNKKIGTYTDTPVMTYTKSLKVGKLYDELKEAGYQFDTDNATDYVVPLTVSMNGPMLTIPSGSNADWTNFGNIKLKQFLTETRNLEIPDGTILEVYADDDNFVTDIVLISYRLMELVTKTEDKASTKLVDERALYFEGYSNVYAYSCNAEDKPAGFDDVYKAAEEGDMVLVAVEGDGFYFAADDGIIGLKMPTTVEGKISFFSYDENHGVNQHATITIDKKEYTISSTADYHNLSGYSTSEVYTFYLDENGYVFGADIATADSNAYGVLKVYLALNDDGELVPMALVVKPDGTEDRLELPAEATDYTGNKGRVVCLEEDDGEYSVAAPENRYKVTSEITKYSKTFTLTGESDTFTFADDYKIIYLGQNDGPNNDNTGKYTVSTKLQDIEGDAYAVLNADEEIIALFVEETADTVVSNVKSLIFLAKQTGFGHDTKANGSDYPIYKYDAYVDGKQVEGGIVALNDAPDGTFYKVAQDTAKKNYYKLSGNEFEGDSDYDVATATDFDVDDIITTKLIYVDGEYVEITKDTKVVCTVEDENIASISALKTMFTSHEYDDVSVTVLFDDETNDALYVYIWDIDFD